MKLLKLVWALFVLALPLLAVWAASSLAAMLDGPLWATLLCGALLFPILPLFWELFAASRFEYKNKRRHASGKAPRKAFLTRGDRLTIRTLFLSIGFLALVVMAFPHSLFPALATKGDWFLQGSKAPAAEKARAVIFAVASKAEGLYRITHPNPWEGLGEVVETPDNIKPPVNTGDVNGPDDNPPESPDQKRYSKYRKAWPQVSEVHPGVAKVPESATKSVRTLGLHFKLEYPDPYERLRVMHDWVAMNISYDWPSIDDASYPYKQKAEQVLKDKRGVCSGYSNLMVGLSKVTGDKIFYVTGFSRDRQGKIGSDVGHAWNGVEIDGAYYLMDVTWDSPKRLGKPNAPKGTFRTTYFLTPPKYFLRDHLPDNPDWQLMKTPINRVEFLRQSLLTPSFYALGLKTDALSFDAGVVKFKVTSKEAHKMLVSVVDASDNEVSRCKTSGSKTIEIDCGRLKENRFVRLFATKNMSAQTLPMVGALRVD